MKRPVFSFRPNLKDTSHRKAWKILESVPKGEKTAYLVQAVLAFEQNTHLEETIRHVIREELQGKCLNLETMNQQEKKEEIPEMMMDFLSMLQKE